MSPEKNKEIIIKKAESLSLNIWPFATSQVSIFKKIEVVQKQRCESRFRARRQK